MDSIIHFSTERIFRRQPLILPGMISSGEY